MKTAKVKWMAILGISLLGVAAGLSPSYAVRSIQVNYPHQGVKLTIGDSAHVDWVVQGKPKGKVNVCLLRNGMKIFTIAKHIPVGQGTVGWILSSNLSAGVYQIRVKTTGADKVVQGLSDPFEIQSKSIPITPQAYREMQKKASQRYEKSGGALGQKKGFQSDSFEIQPKSTPIDPQAYREMQKKASQRYEKSGSALGQKTPFQVTMPPVEVDLKITSVKPIMDYQYNRLKQIDVYTQMNATDTCKLATKWGVPPSQLDHATVAPRLGLELVLGPYYSSGMALLYWFVHAGDSGVSISRHALNKGTTPVRFSFHIDGIPRAEFRYTDKYYPPGPVELHWFEFAGWSGNTRVEKTCKDDVPLHIDLSVGVVNRNNRQSFDSRRLVVTDPKREVWIKYGPPSGVTCH